MGPILPRPRGKEPVVYMIAALLCAAALVLYLQQRALRALDRQTVLILQNAAGQTTTEVLEFIRRTFDGAVFDVLSSIRHPSLVEDRLDAAAPAFTQGLSKYPQVERFFVWTELDGRLGASDVLF